MRVRKPNSWPIRSHRTWSRELAAPQVPTAVSSPSTCCGGGRFSPHSFWCFWYDELLEQLSEHLTSLKTFLLRLQVRRTLKGFFFYVWPAYCWPQKQNDQVIANASLFDTEQKSIGKHRHQCLCVKFGTLTLMEMNCKWVSTKAVIQCSVVWQILCCVLMLKLRTKILYRNWNKTYQLKLNEY